jgi:hypothetical protein
LVECGAALLNCSCSIICTFPMPAMIRAAESGSRLKYSAIKVSVRGDQAVQRRARGRLEVEDVLSSVQRMPLRDLSVRCSRRLVWSTAAFA